VKVALSTIGKFHTFDLARELHAHANLQAIFTAYPGFKLKNERLPRELVHTFPWVRVPYLAFPYKRHLGVRLEWAWEYLDKVAFDSYVARRLEPCDVFVGLSGSALRSGIRAQRLGAAYVCDRGSSHIRAQDQLLREEHALWGIPFSGVNPRVIELEEREYAQSDLITLPSHFAVRTFTEAGISPHKLRRVPYGVDLQKFSPGQPPDPARFDVLFVGGLSLRKGIPYLIRAFRKVTHARKSLTFVGSAPPEFIGFLKARGEWDDGISVVGSIPQAQLKAYMSRSHVMVLPSVEDGFGMVLAQAMACGCPVIGTRNTGTEDVLSGDGVEGFIVPIRDPDALADRLQALADDSTLRARLSRAALKRVKDLGGWSDYGRLALSAYEEVSTFGGRS
jgi:glycosyltransferase involved in cell wall biosynthesis